MLPRSIFRERDKVSIKNCFGLRIFVFMEDYNFLIEVEMKNGVPDEMYR